MYPADLNPNPDPLWPLCLGTSGLLLCWWGHCPCLPCCDSASCFPSLSKQPVLAAPNKGAHSAHLAHLCSRHRLFPIYQHGKNLFWKYPQAVQAFNVWNAKYQGNQVFSLARFIHTLIKPHKNLQAGLFPCCWFVFGIVWVFYPIWNSHVIFVSFFHIPTSLPRQSLNPSLLKLLLSSLQATTHMQKDR